MTNPKNWLAYAQATAVVGLSIVLAWDLAPYFSVTTLLMIYLIGTAGVTTHFGRGPLIMAAVLIVVIFDFLFIPPPLQFGMSDVEHLFALAVIVAVAVIISNRSSERSRARITKSRRATCGSSCSSSGARPGALSLPPD